MSEPIDILKAADGPLIPQEDLDKVCEAIREATPTTEQALQGIERLSAALRQAGVSVPEVKVTPSTAALSIGGMTSHQARMQIEYYDIVNYGRALGLTEDEVTEVLATVAGWARSDPLDELSPFVKQARRRLSLRAMGEDWRP